MEPYDVLGSQTVETPAGPVEISVALNPGGSVTVVAWLRTTGERVGWLRSGTWARLPRAIALNRTLVGPELAGLIAQVLMRTLERLPHPALTGPRLTQTGGVPERTVKELRGLQWLLDELGEHYELDELAARVGLAPGADAVLSEPVARWRRPRGDEQVAPLPLAPTDGHAAGAVYA